MHEFRTHKCNELGINNLDLEVIIGAVFLDDMTLVNNLGITQFLSCWDQIDNI